MIVARCRATRCGNRIRLIDCSGRPRLSRVSSPNAITSWNRLPMNQNLQVGPESPPSSSDESFARKVVIFSHDYLKCVLHIPGVEPAEPRYPQKFYSTLASASTLLEDFLDYHGAKNNKNWYFFRELTAAI